MYSSLRLLEFCRCLLRPGFYAFGWNVAASIFAQGTTFVIALLVSRLLGVGAFGLYSVGQNTIVTAGSLLSMGLSLTLNAHLAKAMVASPADARATVRLGLMAALAFGLPGGVALFIAAPTLAQTLYQDPNLTWPLRVAGLAMPFAVLATVQGGMVSGVEAFRGLALGAAIQFGLTLVVTVFCLSWLGASGALLGMAFGVAMRVIVNQYILHTRLPSQIGAASKPYREIWRRIRPLAIPAALAGATTFPAMWLANASLMNARGAHEYGLFAAALLVKTAVTFVPLQLGTVLLARGVRLRGEGREHDARRQARGALMATLVMTVLMATGVWLAPPEVLLVLGRQFVDASSVVDLMMIVAVVEPLAILLSYEGVRQNRMWKLFFFYSIPRDIALVAGAWWLSSSMGAHGLTLTYLCSWLGALVAALILARPNRSLDAQPAAILPSYGREAMCPLKEDSGR